MSDYSIEMSAEGIIDSRSRRYFSEVYGCYSAGYYRSSVVMLWSVVVTDIMFKLDQLATAYSDSTAQSILSEIGSLRQSNPKSPEWEGELINKVASRTDLIDHAEHSFLQSLHIHRHLSAHPVMTASDALFSPNRETARAHIRNALESVLTKPPIMSRKIFDTFLEDVEQIGRLKPQADGLRKFLEAKYFRNFSSVTFSQVFRSLWRVTFKVSDPRADSNREINVQALCVLFSSRKSEFIDVIKSERDWFSDVSFHEGNIDAMIQFFQLHPTVFLLLSDAIRTPIENYAALDLSKFSSCWFVSSSPDEHVDALSTRIESGETIRSKTVLSLFNSLRTCDAQRKVILIGIRLYFRSGNFDAADRRFDELIRPLISSFDRDHCIAFLEGCETCTNGQATYRGRAPREHAMIKAYIDENFPDIDSDEYTAFKNSLGVDSEP